MTRGERVRRRGAVSLVGLVGLILGLAASPALAGERVAVVIIAPRADDATLADNLTEVAISRLAEDRPGELLGGRELRRLFERSGNGRDIGACIAEAACLERIGAELAVELVVAGTLLREGEGIVLSLTLVETESGRQRKTVTRTSDGAVGALVRMVRESVQELFASPALPKLGLTAATAATSEPAPSLAGAPSAEQGPRRPRWVPLAAYGGAMLGVLSLSAAAVFGTLAEAEPSGESRRDAQMDLERQKVYATTANTLWITGGVLTVASIFTFGWLWRD